MKINTKFTGIEMTQAISDYLAKRLGALEKFINGDETVMVDVELGKTTNHHKSGDIFRAEINLHGKGRSFRAVSSKPDLYAAIDEAKDEMARELSANKDKQISLVRRGGAAIKNLLRFGKNQ
jgi:ribosomal subunit interface protein